MGVMRRHDLNKKWQLQIQRPWQTHLWNCWHFRQLRTWIHTSHCLPDNQEWHWTAFAILAMFKKLKWLKKLTKLKSWGHFPVSASVVRSRQLIPGGHLLDLFAPSTTTKCRLLNMENPIIHIPLVEVVGWALIMNSISKQVCINAPKSLHGFLFWFVRGFPQFPQISIYCRAFKLERCLASFSSNSEGGLFFKLWWLATFFPTLAVASCPNFDGWPVFFPTLVVASCPSGKVGGSTLRRGCCHLQEEQRPASSN